ncbi:hypothetical protein OHC33_008801 [Knufia fluminis]|uniref:WW domain-containing protein n=1 Tax=Knufia fluminis TaxID=191047 RepID=A0AAN8EMI5_9EURO|nr:hypothetical protein OHC33_008801 [Knufia fluminis]
MSASQSSPSLPAKPPAVTPEPVEVTEHVADGSNNSESTTTPPATAKATATSQADAAEEDAEQPPLPAEAPPPLPNEESPADVEDDGWEPVWDENAQAFYFYNKYTQATQWENPRVPQAAVAPSSGPADTGPPGAAAQAPMRKLVAGGYDPAIHGDYDPNADYAKVHEPQAEEVYGEQTQTVDPAAAYAATGAFNRFTGKWQRADIGPERFNDENKSKRQMEAFFNVDAAANSHDGKSLKAERSGKKISKSELKAYREKRREKKEEKKRAWLRD